MAISVKKNIVYSFAYQILAFIIPLVTSPYISRTLGADRLGVYTYTYSIAYYFMMVVMLGIENYGTRSIAKIRDDKQQLAVTFWSIYIIQFTMLVLSLGSYLTYCYFRNSEYMNIQFCQGLCVLSFGLDVTWFFNGKESFKLISIRNGIVKVLNAALIFIFIKSPDDLWLYTLIMGSCTLLGQLIQWPYLIKEIKGEKIRLTNFTTHLKGALILFIPVLAISVFAYMDKIMIGKLSNMSEAGFYENSDKILNVPKAFIRAVGAVMLPHTANMLVVGSMQKVKQSIKTTMFFILWVASASLFGLAGIAPMFSVVFWGDEFARCSDVITIISISLFFSCFGNVIRTQYLIPKERDKEYTISLIIGAVVNFSVNFLLIEKFGAVGAAIGTVAAEVALCSYQAFCVRKELELGKYILRGIPFVLIGLIMAVLLRIMQMYLSQSIPNLLILIVTGGVVFLALSIGYMKLTPDKMANQMLISAKNTIANKLHGKTKTGE